MAEFIPTYSMKTGDFGEVLLDGVSVKATSCNPAEGWAVCHVKKDGNPVKIGEPSELHDNGNAVRERFIRGYVVFKRRADNG